MEIINNHLIAYSVTSDSSEDSSNNSKIYMQIVCHPYFNAPSICVRGCGFKHFFFANEDASEEQEDVIVVSVEDENDEEMGDNEDTKSTA